MAQIWVTVSQACETFAISRRTLSRWVKQGKVESKLENNRRLVLVIEEGHSETLEGHIETPMAQDMSQQVLIEQLQKENDDHEQQIAYLREQNENLQRQVEEASRALAEASQRHDTIVLQLTRQLENQQRLLEYQQAPWYRRWFRKGRTEQ